MRTRELNILAIAIAAASPAAAQVKSRTITVDVQDVVQHAHVAAAHAERMVSMVLPMAMAAVQPALMSVGPALAGVEPALAMVEPTLAGVEPALRMAFSGLGNISIDAGDIDISFTDDELSDFVPEPWAAQDPADSLYRAARRALNDEDYARAAQLFSRIHDDPRYKSSEYRAISFYWEAFAREKLGGRGELQVARTALDQMRTQHATAWREQREAPALLARVNAGLARLGDAQAAQRVRVSGSSAAREKCTDENMVVKVEALNALLQMDAESALPILEEVMKKRGTDECTAELRRKAVFLISQKRSDRSADLLLEAARNDPDPEVQEQAVFWLSQVSGDKAVQAIEQVLRTTDNRKVQERAIFALSQHRSDRAAALLKDFAVRTDVSDEMRGNAIFWLGQHRGEDNAKFLREIYPKVNSREVKEKVLFSIAQIRGDESADWLVARALDEGEDVEIRKNALFWAGQQRAIPISKLNDLYQKMPNKQMKSQLVFVLSQRARDPEAVDLLIRIAQNEKDPEIRKNAIFWLGQSKDPRASKFLLDLIKN